MCVCAKLNVCDRERVECMCVELSVCVKRESCAVVYERVCVCFCVRSECVFECVCVCVRLCKRDRE